MQQKSTASRSRVKTASRYMMMFVLACALAVLSMDLSQSLPGAPGTVEAGCFTFASSQCDVLSGISVCDIGSGNYKVTFRLANNADGGTAFSSCGLGEADLTGLSPGGTMTENCIPGEYTVMVTPSSLPATLSYRVTAYVNGQPKKWTGNYTFNVTGACVSNQSCPF